MSILSLLRSPRAASLSVAGAFALALAPTAVYGNAPFALEPSAPQSEEKTDYHLFNPTPRELMRPLSADRPDKAESPYTVDAGHVQIETDFVSFTENWDGSERTRTWGGPNPNIKIGLLNNLDIEFAFDTYLSERGRDKKRAWKRSGVGDTEVRLKLNLVGNDGGTFAAALLPYIHLPTSRSGLGSSKVEGGLLVPAEIELPGGWDLALQAGVHIVEGEHSPGRQAVVEQVIALGHDIIGKLAGYAEFYSAIPTEKQRGWVATVDLGLTYAVTDDIQLDCGVNIGVTPAADDWNPLIGITVRF